jgi:hypothetical protein
MAIITQLGDTGFAMTQQMFLENSFLKPHDSWLS